MKTPQQWKAEDIISLVPDTLLDNLSQETNVDYSVKKLHGKSVFKLFLFAFLTGGGISLRILEAIFKSERFKTLFNIPEQSIKHSTIGMRLANIDYRYFEKIFQYLIHHPRLEVILFDRQRVAVSKIDSTIVTLSSKLLSVGLDDNPGVKSLKFGVELRQGIPVNIMLFEGQKNLSEDNALPLMIFHRQEKKALNIAVFDRGIQRKQNFVDFHNRGIFFISRLSTQKVRVVKRLPLLETSTPSLKIVSDQIVQFESAEHLEPKDAQTEFRLVTGKSKLTKQPISFLTNIRFLSAVEITELYKSRWEIETFFKFIKQQLSFSHLLSRNENGIRVVMYLTMIAAILLTLYKKLNNIMGWAVAKIQFLDELYVETTTAWKAELVAAFTSGNINSS